jgi:tRNA (guanine37-N1)-methyltransferase
MRNTAKKIKKGRGESGTGKPKVTFHIVTLFPESFDSYVNSSIIGRAIRDKHIAVAFYNPRDFAKPTKSQRKRARPYIHIDDKPYGGGPGMVLQALPVIKAVEAAIKSARKEKVKVVLFSVGGEPFTNTYAKTVAVKFRHIVLVCGRYEGIDARVAKIFKADELSVGPFVLTGGELPALVLIDAAARQIPGVLGDFESVEENRVSSHDVYTRPETLKYKGKSYKVPPVLLSGDHKGIELWKKGLTGKGD